MMAHARLSLSVATERWPIRGSFAISRGAKTEAIVVVATVTNGVHRGRGECVPYARYGESAASVTAAIEAMAEPLRDGLDRDGLQRAMPPGAARNALDCALWDVEAKRAGRAVHDLAGLAPPRSLVTAFTISLGTSQAMAEAARAAGHRPLLKIKLGADGDPARLAAIRASVPDVELVVDANEGWTEANLEANLAAAAEAGVTLVEQPLPAGHDDALLAIARPIPVCADESAHDAASLASLVGRYDAVNVKLDKTGGLTGALLMAAEAERLGLRVMVGCMVATSLSMAPAMLVAQGAHVVDLDGPLLLAHDRDDGLLYDGSLVHPPRAALWG